MKPTITGRLILRYEGECWLLYRHHKDMTQSVQYLMEADNGYNTIPDAFHRYQILRSIGGIYV